MTTPKGIGCCKKCAFHEYGDVYCDNKSCPCHAPKGIEELREKWLAGDVWTRLWPQDNEAVIAFASSVSSARDEEWREKVEVLRDSGKLRQHSLISPLENYRIDDQEYGYNTALDDLLTSMEK